MINYLNGDLLDVDAGIIVHGCNCQGVMGAGVAKQIKQRYPECYREYQHYLPTKKLGETIWHPVNERLWIVNALTQEFARFDPANPPISYPALFSALDYTISYGTRSGHDIHLPDMIGCGLAGGDRDRVITMLEFLVKKNNFMNNLCIWKF